MIEKIKVWLAPDETLDFDNLPEHSLFCTGCTKRSCLGYTVKVDTFHRNLKNMDDDPAITKMKEKVGSL